MTGTGALLRAALQRDRVLVPIWLAVLAGMVAASAFATEGLYADAHEREAAARLINTSPALVGLYGPIRNPASLGDLAMSKLTVTYAMAVMGLALVLVRRHTRAEEESGRAELVGAAGVDRAAPLRAAVVESAAVVVVLGLLAALIDVSAGLGFRGSVAFGASWVGVGLVGTGLAALCCQLSPSSRTCGALTLAAIAVLDLIRAAGDLGPDWLGWLSPLGWGTRLEAWGQPRWWLLGVYAVTAALLLSAAEALRARRDVGAGVLADRPGPERGTLASVSALGARLTRPAFITWLLASVAFGALFGSVVPHLGGLFDSPTGRAALEALGGEGRAEEAMLAAILAIMAALLCGFALQVATSTAHEETDGRTAQILTTHAGRARVWSTAAALVVVGTAALTTAYGVGSALGYGPQTDGVADALRTLVPAAWAHLPAMWVVGALGLLAWAWQPTRVWLGWAALGVFLVLGDIGPLLHAPHWLLGLSPFEHVARVPVQPVSATATVALCLVATALLAASWALFRRRDLA